ncbi:MAG: 3-methyl-2-oxobutanoate dehydrogenase subunit VorB [Oscillospiraceae bacterium]|nr:3-methyl-2-oxobutanoate dehydrogenase subunit VorB [Oscillospiraceae bacterium]
MEKVLMKGNEAIAEAAVMAGCKHFFGYPITPQNELAAYMSQRMPRVGGTYLQAESEIAAINMVIGAAAAGVRAMTSSSSPGIALKSEGLSYLAGCDLPAVLVNVQRAGPGLGGIQPSQADYFMAVKGGGHGDFHTVVFAPNSIQEMVDYTFAAFDIAEKYRVTVMLLTDGILGQMMEPVALIAPETKAPAEKPWAVTGTKGARPKNIVNSLYLSPELLEKVNIARFERYDEIKRNETRCELYKTDDAEICVVAYGAASRISRNAVEMARAKGIRAGLIRPITLWPFPSDAILEAADRVKAFTVVEMSMGQMIQDVELAARCKKPVNLCFRTGGMVPSPEEVLKSIEEVLR